MLTRIGVGGVDRSYGTITDKESGDPMAMAGSAVISSSQYGVKLNDKQYGVVLSALKYKRSIT